MIAVETKKLRKIFQSHDSQTIALDDVDFNVKKGEFVMIVGPSGCGKTTLISVVAGILSPDSGDLNVLGKDLCKISPDELLKFRAESIGFIFQSFNLLPTISVLENVSVPLLINGYSLENAKEKAMELITKVGLKDKANLRPNLLSGGQQQRVAIARALCHNPALVICDEPTSALDYESGVMVLDIMKKVNQENQTTFLIVTHDSRIYHYADRVVKMNDGKMTEEKKSSKTAKME